jgi:hypothetical protein
VILTEVLNGSKADSYFYASEEDKILSVLQADRRLHDEYGYSGDVVTNLLSENYFDRQIPTKSK